MSDRVIESGDSLLISEGQRILLNVGIRVLHDAFNIEVQALLRVRHLLWLRGRYDCAEALLVLGFDS